jgi:DNA-binding response OmpR family regulator
MAIRHEKVLVIEDDETFVKFIKRVLTVEGYTVICAANGRDGLVAIRQHQPSVVLLDIGLPIMDGEALLAVYHSQNDVQVPIIVMSGGEKDVRKLPPVAGFLQKPFEVQMLIDLVAQYTPRR